MESGGEGRPGQPAFQQFGESKGRQSGNARDIVTALVNRQRLHVGTISNYCTMWSDMAVFVARTQSEAVRRTIWNVSLGLDYLAFTERYDQISEGQKTFIREDIPMMLKNEGTDQVVLSYEDAKLLQLAAAVVNIAYDPGGAEDTPENSIKRTFVFTDLERNITGSEVSGSTRAVDAEQ